MPCPIMDLSPFQESPLAVPTAPLAALDPATLTSGVMDLVGQGVNSLAAQARPPYTIDIIC